MKVFKKVISILLTTFVLLLLSINIASFITSKTNYGNPKLFGVSYMTVLTDSMEPTIPTNALITVKEVKDVTTLQPQITEEGGNITTEGDIITFYRVSDKKVVTHRLLSMEQNTDGTYTLEAFGDNLTSEQCNGDCSTYPHDFINSKYLIGKVTNISVSFGKVYSVLRNPYISGALIFIPGGYVVISSLIDFIKKAKILKEEEAQEVVDARHGDADAEKQVILEEAKRLAKIEHEKELAKKEEENNEKV